MKNQVQTVIGQSRVLMLSELPDIAPYNNFQSMTEYKPLPKMAQINIGQNRENRHLC